MGCDIHMYPERKGTIVMNGKPEDFWTFVYRYQPDEFSKDRYPRADRNNYFAWTDRWYWFFSQLADCGRGNGPPIAPNRGLPEEMSEEVQREMQDSDYHSRSWLTLAELRAHPWEERHDGTLTFKDIAPVLAWLDRLAEIDPDPNNVRIVFAFDN